jgi:hypothetical protein
VKVKQLSYVSAVRTGQDVVRDALGWRELAVEEEEEQRLEQRK